MIRIKLKHLLADLSFRSSHRVTLKDVARETGISRATITRIANERGYNATLSNIDALCRFFECQPGDLLEYIPDDESGD